MVFDDDWQTKISAAKKEVICMRRYQLEEQLSHLIRRYFNVAGGEDEKLKGEYQRLAYYFSFRSQLNEKQIHGDESTIGQRNKSKKRPRSNFKRRQSGY